MWEPRGTGLSEQLGVYNLLNSYLPQLLQHENNFKLKSKVYEIEIDKRG